LHISTGSKTGLAVVESLLTLVAGAFVLAMLVSKAIIFSNRIVFNTTRNRVLEMIVVDRTRVGSSLLDFGEITSCTVSKSDLLVLSRLHCAGDVVHLLVRNGQSGFQCSMAAIFKELFRLSNTEMDLVEL